MRRSSVREKKAVIKFVYLRIIIIMNKILSSLLKAQYSIISKRKISTESYGLVFSIE